jgi:hypothetical protein
VLREMLLGAKSRPASPFPPTAAKLVGCVTCYAPLFRALFGA